jgi:hypothetical protein
MTTTLRCLLAALVLAGAPGSAHALVLDVGDLLAGPASLGRVFVAPTSFIDVFNFTLSGPAAVSFDRASGGIAGLTLTSPEDASGASAGGALLAGDLDPGPYSASEGVGSGNGSYAITLGTAPEPAGWMLFVAGLGLIALIARKRLKSGA